MGSRRCFRGALAGVLVLLGAPLAAAAQSDHAARQVLVLQSMDRGSLVFDSFTTNFRAALQSRAGARVTLFDFVVAPAGLNEAPEKPVIEFLQSLYADRRPPELIVTVGGPAAAFIRKHRQDLFPHIPVLFAAVEVRFLRDTPLSENETSVAVSIDYTRIVDDVLQLLPETRNVFMVTGSGPLSTFWYAELQRDFERYRNRLTFIWSHELSYEQMLQRAATLPPHSVIFYITAGTFATGGWQGDERSLAELSTRASAPIVGVQTVWLGRGIVGGHLLDIDDLGATTADVVMRILNGEAPASITIPPRTLGRATFDERQLQRWGISESRLPAGSTLAFRAPSLWRDYRREVLSVLGALFLQSLLIIGLLYQRRARQRAEVESRHNLALAADANRRQMMSALTGSIAHELSQPLSSILHNSQAGKMLVESDRATPETLRDILSDIYAADVRATQIIKRHRSMLKAHQVEQKLIDVRAVVHESLSLVSHDTNAKRIELVVDLPADACTVAGDQVLLQQVLVNLIVNGIEAMADTPPDRRRITVQCQASEDNAVVSVRDAGTGLPAKVDGQLFEPFVTTKTTGMGIGLTIARSIVEAHRGNLKAHNNPDGGATFTLTLPRARRVERIQPAGSP
jgi:signal transduction histidine kinase